MAAVFVVLASTSSVRGQEIVDLPGTDRELSADFEEVFRVGSINGDVWETFGEIAGLAFDAQGNLFVLDRQALQVTVIDREGNFVRTIGSEGEGPGEFRMPMQFTVMRDGQKKDLEVTLGELPRDVMAQWIGNHMLESHMQVAATQ